MSVAEIRKTVSGFPEKERAKLAAWLLESLPLSDESDAEAESVEEAARRRAELDSGKVNTLSDKELWAGIEQERKRWS